MQLQKYQLRQRLMGSDFELTVTDTDEQSAQAHLAAGVAEIQRIERLLTVFDPASVTAVINQSAGRMAVDVPAEVYALMQRCMRLSAMTQGAFDISTGALKALYNFKGRAFALPTKGQLQAAQRQTGYQHIDLTRAGQVFLRQSGMQIGFGAIGKGYAADRVKALLLQRGVRSGVINASGDLTAWGQQPSGEAWKVGIADPVSAERVLLWLPIQQSSVATSGNYEQYFEVNGERYSHNIDPRTGMPVQGIKSVTIVSPSAELSDALATAVTVMGVCAGLYLTDQLPDVHAIVIDEENRIHTSRQIQLHTHA
ncbi:FAD:protein FMN transferase [Chitinophaga pendula]|uniref:FAD:protein FMN transferase n=1 Tax=Chitinophaga TaxID=79328 RepID=UPI000BAEDEE5|nr:MULTISPECIES: FAD:protein FMN transferase [Chitinophaga]ASZ11266.1 thiamine biosynthesis protein ApbE [Chitinophaga sp. MD30]UCJ05734.1 FAD:protein FMN transferase [Chitinophaga pendula]